MQEQWKNSPGYEGGTAPIRTLSLDLETYSSENLTKCGVYRYAEAPDFEVLLFGYSADGAPVQVVDLAAGETLPANVRSALTDPAVTKWAFNAQFERVCLSRYLGYPNGQYLDPSSWHCTMVWAATLGLPLSLEGVGAVLGLEKQKLKEGKDLIASKVEKDGIISAINQSSEKVAIQAKRINLNGSVTANNYFKIKTDGSMEAVAGQIGGFNINSDYIAFGDWTHAGNWLSMCTPHGGAGDVYLGKGGISTDSFDGQSDSIVRSIKLTEGTVGFYKGKYECGFIGMNDNNEISMSLMDKEKNNILCVHHNWLELPVLTQVSGDLSVLGSKARCVKTKDYGQRRLYAYETPTPYFGDIGEAVIAEDGLCYVPIDPVFAQCVSLEGYQVFLQTYGESPVCLEERHYDHFLVSGTPGTAFGWELKAKQIDFDQLRMTEDRGLADTAATNYGAEAASYLTSITEGRITA